MKARKNSKLFKRVKAKLQRRLIRSFTSMSDKMYPRNKSGNNSSVR